MAEVSGNSAEREPPAIAVEPGEQPGRLQLPQRKRDGRAAAGDKTTTGIADDWGRMRGLKVAVGALVR
jgi:hypothetical protein